MLPLLAGSIALGALQTGIGLAQLHKLNKEPMPNYSITPEQMASYSRAQGRTGYGFSPEQRADYFQNVAGRYAQNYGSAMKLSGGNSSAAIGRALQSGQLRDFSSFAAGDAQQQQSNIGYADQIGGQITQQRNMIANQDIQNRIRKEQAYGGAVQSGLQNLAGAANFFAMNDGFAQLGGGNKGNSTSTPNVIGQGVGQGWGIGPDGAYNANYRGGSYGGPPAGGWQAQNQMGMNGYMVQPNQGYIGYGAPQIAGQPFGGVPFTGGIPAGGYNQYRGW